jgi:hypothetical protein
VGPTFGTYDCRCIFVDGVDKNCAWSIVIVENGLDVHHELIPDDGDESRWEQAGPQRCFRDPTTPTCRASSAALVGARQARLPGRTQATAALKTIRTVIRAGEIGLRHATGREMQSPRA